MSCVRCWVACLLMVLVPLQAAAAAAKVCCLVRGHVIAVIPPPITVELRTLNEQQLVPSAALVHSSSAELPLKHADASSAECAICATLCHSVAITPTTAQAQDPHFSREHPEYAVDATVAPPVGVPEKPPRV